MPSIKTILYISLLVILIIIIAQGLGAAFTPLLSAIFLAYLLFPVVQILESKNIKRQYAIIGVFSIMLTLILTVIIAVLPSLFADAKLFLSELPQNATKTITTLEKSMAEVGLPVIFDKQQIMLLLQKYASPFSTKIIMSLTNILQLFFSNFITFLISILYLFLFPIFFFYVINDYEKIINSLSNIIPEKIRPKANLILNQINAIIIGYIRGQCLVALILAILYATGLSLIGLKFGFLIGITTGLLSIIPYVGFTIGIISTSIILFSGAMQIYTILAAVILFLSIHILESFFLTPKLVGNKLGLNTLTTMIALIIGGNLAGLWGMLLAIPCAAITKYAVKYTHNAMNFHKAY